MGGFSRILGKLNDRIFLDHDIERLRVIIEVEERQLASDRARLVHLLEKKYKESLDKK